MNITECIQNLEDRIDRLEQVNCRLTRETSAKIEAAEQRLDRLDYAPFEVTDPCLIDCLTDLEAQLIDMACREDEIPVIKQQLDSIHQILLDYGGRIDSLEQRMLAAHGVPELAEEVATNVYHSPGLVVERQGHHLTKEELLKEIWHQGGVIVGHEDVPCTFDATTVCETEPAEVDDAVSLLMKCVPILDLRVSEHNDGRRLRSAICQWLADRGYPGWLEAREPVQDPTKRMTLADEVNALRRRVAELEQPNCKAYEEKS